jgi:hypothetical protein
LRYQRNSGQTGTNGLNLITPVETSNAIPYAGKIVTYSFYARKGADYSATSNALVYYVRTGTGTDQNPFSAYTGGALTISSTATLTTTWQRFTATATLPVGTTEFAPQFEFTPTGTASTNDYFEVTGIQLEVGSVATQFSRAGSTIQQELAACQRYFYTITSADAAFTRFGVGQAYATTAASFALPFPVSLRVAPSSVTVVGNVAAITANAATLNNGTIAIEATSKNLIGLGITGTSGLVAGNATQIMSNNTTSASLSFSAEL